MRRLLLLAPLALIACHREAPQPPAGDQQGKHAAGTLAPTPSPQQQNAEKESRENAAGAADVLRHYYALIEAGRYDDAWKMRSGGKHGIDPQQFAAHFKAYESYRSQVGVPSEPVRADDWIYVEVPVMTTGRFLGGKAFGSTGSVTLRRPAPGSAADEPGWRIYTS
jgi:hypothetical protein